MSGFNTAKPTIVSADIAAQNTFTDPISLEAGETTSISISGTWAGTVVPQRRLPGQSSYNDVPNADGTIGFTANTEKSYFADERCDFRLGIKTGAYTSGIAVCRLGKG